MARGVADIVEVVVLAAGAHAFLRGGGALIGPLLDAGEDVLELHHAGIGEHQGRVVARHQRRRRHDLVAVLGKEVQKGRPDLVNAAHVHPIAKAWAGLCAIANGMLGHLRATTLLDKGARRCPETVQADQGLPQARNATVDRCCDRVDRLGAVVVSSYLFKTATSGETGLNAGAEGATAPETLRQTDRRGLTASGKRRRRALGPRRVRRRDNTLRHSDRWGFDWFSRESVLGNRRGPRDACARRPIPR